MPEYLIFPDPRSFSNVLIASCLEGGMISDWENVNFSITTSFSLDLFAYTKN